MKLSNHKNAVIYFIQQMDIEMIDDILDNDLTYQKFEKDIFIDKLSIALQKFTTGGDTFLECHTGLCNNESCNYQCSGYSFIGNESKNYMDLIIETENDIVKDIFECRKFKNSDPTIDKKIRIQIDEDFVPF
jgi:hypothetical protein